MNVPWKVILAFVGVFIAGAVFGGVFTMGVSARRFANPPRQMGPVERPIAQLPPVNQPLPQVAGPQAPSHLAQPRGNPITPQLMNQFTRRLPGLTAQQKETLRTILGRAGEDFHRLRVENLADVTRVTERMYADVSGILTMEQRSELEKMRKQLEERLQADKKKRAEAAAALAAEGANRAGNNPPPPRPNATPPGTP
jgi:hypothetical protein